MVRVARIVGLVLVWMAGWIATAQTYPSGQVDPSDAKYMLIVSRQVKCPECSSIVITYALLCDPQAACPSSTIPTRPEFRYVPCQTAAEAVEYLTSHQDDTFVALFSLTNVGLDVSERVEHEKQPDLVRTVKTYVVKPTAIPRR